MSALIGDMSARTMGLSDSWTTQGVETNSEQSEATSRVQWQGAAGAFDLQQSQLSSMQSMQISSEPDMGMPDLEIKASRVEQHLGFNAAFDFSALQPGGDDAAGNEMSIVQNVESSISAALSTNTGFANVLAAFDMTHSATIESLLPDDASTAMQQSVTMDSVTESFEVSAMDGSLTMSGQNVLSDMTSVVSTSDGMLEMIDATSETNAFAMKGDGFSLDYASRKAASITQLTDMTPTNPDGDIASTTALNSFSEQMSFASGDMKLDFSRTETTQQTVSNMLPTDASQTGATLPTFPANFGVSFSFPDLNLPLPQPGQTDSGPSLGQSSFATNINLNLDATAGFSTNQMPFAAATDVNTQFGQTMQNSFDLGIAGSV